MQEVNFFILSLSHVSWRKEGKKLTKKERKLKALIKSLSFGYQHKCRINFGFLLKGKAIVKFGENDIQPPNV